MGCLVAQERRERPPSNSVAGQIQKAAHGRPFPDSKSYRVDSISKPQASKRGSGMYFEFLFLRAHSRRRVERMYWSGRSLYSFTACSKDVTVGMTGPIGSGLPQFGFPRRFAIMSSNLPIKIGEGYSKNRIALRLKKIQQSAQLAPAP